MINELRLSLLKFNVPWHEVENKLIEIGMKDYAKIILHDDWDEESCSRKPFLRYVFFAMASLVLKDVKNILEIGTGGGLTTKRLASLFPKSIVYTIDMPKSDPAYHKGWRGTNSEASISRCKKNIDMENIRFIESNSFFLPVLDLPKKFDLIFVDGDHLYPVVASDIMFSYHSLVDGGFLFMHDYETSFKPPGLHVASMVNWMRKRIKETILLFPQNHPGDKMACLVKGRFLK